MLAKMKNIRILIRKDADSVPIIYLTINTANEKRKTN